MKVFEQPTMDTAMFSFKSVPAQPRIPKHAEHTRMYTESNLLWGANQYKGMVRDLVFNETSKRRFATNGCF